MYFSKYVATAKYLHDRNHGPRAWSRQDNINVFRKFLAEHQESAVYYHVGILYGEIKKDQNFKNMTLLNPGFTPYLNNKCHLNSNYWSVCYINICNIMVWVLNFYGFVQSSGNKILCIHKKNLVILPTLYLDKKFILFWVLPINFYVRGLGWLINCVIRSAPTKAGSIFFITKYLKLII